MKTEIWAKWELFTELYCCYFLSAGLAHSLFRALPWEHGPSWVIWLGPSIGLLLLLLAKNIRKVALPLIMVTSLVLLHYLPQWLIWWETGRALDYNTLLHLLIALVLTWLIYLLLRLGPSLPILAYLVLLALAWLYIYGVRGWATSLYLLAAGLLPWAAMGTVRSEAFVRGRAGVFSIGLSAPLILAVFLLLPADTEAWRWQAWSDKVADMKQEMRELYRSWQLRDKSWPALDLDDRYHARLGGPINPDNTRMLVVKTKSPQLLKGSVYYYYTGVGWAKSELGPYVSQGQAAALEAMPLLEPDHPLTPFAGRREFTVTLLHPQEDRLFYWGRIREFSTKDQIEPFISPGSELESRLPLANGYTYTFSSVDLDRRKGGFTEIMAELSPKLSWEELNQLYTRDPLEVQAMQLPTYLVLEAYYGETGALLQEILGEHPPASLYEQALLLESWLQENCTYTLSPSMPPSQGDFVLHFLHTREGYCTYYASAMVILSRILGIPARYVTGYALEPITGLDRYEATNATAHAWAELYFTGVGWLTFDPTGQVNFQEEDEGLHFDMTDREFFGPNITAVLGRAIKVYWRQALVLLLVVFMGALWWLRQRKKARLAYDLPWLDQHLPPKEILERYYRGLLKQWALLGWEHRPQETILSFMRRLSQHWTSQGEGLLALGEAVSALRYGGQEPSKGDLQGAADLYSLFADMARQQRRPYKG